MPEAARISSFGNLLLECVDVLHACYLASPVMDADKKNGYLALTNRIGKGTQSLPKLAVLYPFGLAFE
jgi:hypothetical protein